MSKIDNVTARKTGAKQLDPYESIPKAIRIGCYDFGVELMSKRESDSAKEYGHCSMQDQMIRIADGLNSQQVANTLLHEVIHAVHWVFGPDALGEEEEAEEKFTTQGANGLMAVWRDNPGFIAWLNLMITSPVAKAE